jgi:hypothetical protein
MTLKPQGTTSVVINPPSSQKNALNSVFPPTKLATAMAWHEESIREENEFAENDEGMYMNNNNSLEDHSSSRSSSKR